MRSIRYKPIYKRCAWEVYNSFYPMSVTYLVRDWGSYAHWKYNTIILICCVEISCTEKPSLVNVATYFFFLFFFSHYFDLNWVNKNLTKLLSSSQFVYSVWKVKLFKGILFIIFFTLWKYISLQNYL